MKLFDLTGKVAIVTGGNGGIGLGMAKGLAGAGARVVLAGRNAAKGAKAAAELGGAAVFMAADVTKKADCEKLVADTVARFGRLDILVNNAGTAIRKNPQDYTEAEWHKVMDTNMTSAFLCSQAAYPHLVASGARNEGGAKVVNIGSVMSLFGAPHAAPYAASKGAIMQFTKAIATAWAKDNIQCNAVLPGWIDTELTMSAREQVAGLNEAVLARTPAARWGVPEDLSGIAVFLASPGSDFVTGTAIPCDGGCCARA
ncbi:SDR family NAD(P)-dependent oxidoreductase [Limobrevibacterium gyesilva]|uniref:Glucose 1-dehydrogenase n=1 Tax=Limobrevibacterium gyesilva TaxID=2991712 RepID=A0AA42CHX8_9PROT|nr:glucose 1-dehydrogenase [Limobrevibacterium gyesilva]MCW3475412.1 glucose 1-dehydrogenase [Limobrevibacterium gyesilva]